MAAFMPQAELSSDIDYMVMNLKYLLLCPLQEKKKKKTTLLIPGLDIISLVHLVPATLAVLTLLSQGLRIGCPFCLKYSSFRYQHGSLPYLLLGLKSNATFSLRPTLVILLKIEICQPYIPFQFPLPCSIFFITHIIF